jgi:hypothetical protein
MGAFGKGAKKKVEEAFNEREYKEAKALWKSGVISDKQMRQEHLKKFKSELTAKHGKGWFGKVTAKGRAWNEKNAKLVQEDVKPMKEKVIYRSKKYPMR